MADTKHETMPSRSPIVRLWERLPIAIRAIAVGFLAFVIIGSLAWTTILILVPTPWSILVMALVLWAYWRYCRGSWWPETTAKLRSTRFRATKMTARVWTWSTVAALLAVVVFQSSLVIAFRIMEFPAEVWSLGYDFAGAPAWQVWLFILMAALVAGITEEIGFRGYMQVPLERRYGPAVAIAIVPMMFVVVHLNQAWAGGILIVLIATGVLWGVLARVAGSLIPGIISHTVTDIINFSFGGRESPSCLPNARLVRQVSTRTSSCGSWFL